MRFSRVSSQVWTPGSSLVHIANFVSHVSIQVKQKTDRPALPPHETLKKRLKQRARRIVNRSIGFKILGQTWRVRERVFLDSRLQKKFEWIVRGQVRDEVHVDQKFARLLGEEKARKTIIVRVQLPVQNVFGGGYVKRVAEDWRSTMQCGTQLDHLGTEGYRFFVPVECPVIQRNLYAHPPPRRPHLEFRACRPLATLPTTPAKMSHGSRGVNKR